MFYFCALFLLASLYSNETNREIFTEEFNRPFYIEDTPLSEKAIAECKCLLNEYEIFSLLDVGCGKNPKIDLASTYLGIDIVDSIVASNAEQYPNNRFLSMDITEDNLPSGDLLFSRDIFNYFSVHDIWATIQKFKQSKSTYILLNTFPKLQENKESNTGIRRKINFEAFPFFFPKPLASINDDSEDGKVLALWKLEDLDLSYFEKWLLPTVTLLTKKIGGTFIGEHAGVVNSAKRGLKQIHCNFNYNPEKVSDVKDNVIVITDLFAGIQAYEWKKENRIKTLLVGPNFAPSEPKPQEPRGTPFPGNRT